MFFTFGTPRRLSDLGVTLPDLSVLKRWIEIAVLDDEPFLRSSALRTHGFHVTELGGDIKSVDQVAQYPIVVCDIRGVGKSFGSRFEGAHVISEIRKSYPDKFLIAYTGMIHDIAYNDKLSSADVSANKDAPIDQWTQLLERGLKSVGDPKQRWIRFRSTLLEKNVDLFDVFELEQSFIKSIEGRNSGVLLTKAMELGVSHEITDLIAKFAGAAVAGLIEHAVLSK